MWYMFCNQCGHEIKSGYKFCQNCGNAQYPAISQLEKNDNNVDESRTISSRGNNKSEVTNEYIADVQESLNNAKEQISHRTDSTRIIYTSIGILALAGITLGGYTYLRHIQYENDYTNGINALNVKNYALAKSYLSKALILQHNGVTKAAYQNASSLLLSQQSLSTAKKEFEHGKFRAALYSLKFVLSKDTTDFAMSQSLMEKISKAITAQKLSDVKFIESNGSTVTLPLVGIKTTYGISYPTQPSVTPRTPLSPIRFNIPSSQINKLSLYWVNEGGGSGFMFLGPRGWFPTTSEIGADGSELFKLQSPMDITQTMTVTDDGGCAGCTISDIGSYFPGESSWAAKMGFPVTTFGSNPSFHYRQRISPSTMVYSLIPRQPGYQTNGVAYMQSSGNMFFGREQITMPTSDHTLETTILNFYLGFYR